MTKEKAKLVLDSLSTWVGQERLITDEIVEAIRTLSQPSLPSDLDEAAEEAMRRAYPGDAYYYVGRPARRLFKEGFKAGAEWMAERGVTVDGKVIMDFSEPSDIINRRLIAKLGDALLKVEPGEVVVQIRNK